MTFDASRIAFTIITLTQRGSLSFFFFFTLLLPLPPSRSIHWSCRPNNPPPRVSIYAFHAFVCTDGVCVRAIVCVEREIRFSVERNNTVEQSANDGEERGGGGGRGGLSSPFLSVFLSLSLARTCEPYTTNVALREGNEMREERISCCERLRMHLPQPLKLEPRASTSTY